MNRLLPATLIIILTSIALIIFKINGTLPRNNTALLVVLILQIALVVVSGTYYLGFRITSNNSGLLLSVAIIGALIAYIIYSFKLYDAPVVTILILAVLAVAIMFLWPSEEKSAAYYIGITILGFLGGGLIYYRFKDLSWISVLLGVMTAVLIISLSLLLEEENEEVSS
jgi:hypothetical protein